jgi:Ca2+-binding RTX toxin-like protein
MGTYTGTSGSNTLHGRDGMADDIFGLGGDDFLFGHGGDDRLFGGQGGDVLFGGTGTNDTAVYIHDATVGVFVSLETGLGHNGSAEGDRLFDIENLHGTYRGDWLFGNSGPNRLRGAWGDDLLKGGGGSDHLLGDDDNDTLVGGGGGDTLDGGAHIDTAAYDGSPTGVFVSILPGWLIADWGDAAGDTLISIENLTGSAHGDVLFGDDATNVLRGMDGGDTLKGGGGDDRLEGGYGDDTLGGGAGEDTLIGGLGRDTASYSASSTGVHVELGSIALLGDADGDILSGIENLTGSDHFDQLFGDNSANVLRGLDGPDRLYGHAGSDTLEGGDGDDRLSAGEDIPGVVGVDIMSGGIGNDDLTGHSGEDWFLFDTPLDAMWNVDDVIGFNVTDDTIRLDATIFSSDLAVGSSVAGSQFVIGTAALDAGDRIIYDNATGVVLYDSDGTGATAAIQFAQLSAGLADPTDIDPLTNFDFFVVA